ncbi:MAG TPA: tRNA (N6-isopentenyl adenosine(37)-C2)-methylthiotransferase MiaB [Acidimicrobiia bacterium]|nr:tRNA (N6-isopentenyl adenosine(37)-C2)-methylthiotransferase MiaB [Acidimicrobiia bacterium]
MTSTNLGLPAVKAHRVPTRSGRQYVVRTFGCQMNEHDSERITGLFEADGMHPAHGVDDADVVMINTCCIRENADNRLYGNLGHLKSLKDRRPEMRILVGGCLAQKDRDIVREKAPWVDVVFGTHNLHRVIDLLDYAEEWGPVTEIWEETRSIDDVPSSLPTKRDVDHSAWVTITIGCNNACTFCIVPLVRGAEISRRPGDIVREVRELAADGVVEVTLLGQNVNSYGRDLAVDGRRRPIFADLLRRVGEVDGIGRIRFTSPHPKDIKEDVAVAMAETPAVCENLHLPLQSGSARILRAMQRGYTPGRFLEKLRMAEDIVPGLATSTDVIVGFPGETEADFQGTLDVMAEARFDHAYMFIYSPRPGTRAAEMDDQVDPDVSQERFSRLVALQQQISLDKNEALLGTIVEVLTEGPSKKDPGMATARTRTNKVVHVPGRFEPGSFLRAAIERAAPSHLIGSVVP